MEKELKAKAIKEALVGSLLFIIGMFIMLVTIFIANWATTKTFHFDILLYILIPLLILTILYVIIRVRFINKLQLTYGKIIKIEKSSSKESEVYQNFIIKYTDESTNKECQTIVYDHFGDNVKELGKEIEKFYQDGQKLSNKKVPVLYTPNNPNKTIVFFENAI